MASKHDAGTDATTPATPDSAAHAPTIASATDDPAHALTHVSSPRIAAVTLEIGARLGGRYLVQAFLGEGGMGAVYRVLDETLGQVVALKVVRGTIATSTRLRDEVLLSQRVTHPNVCRTYDLEDIDGCHIIKMEYVAGETLSALLDRDGRLPLPRVIAVARAIAAGLAAAHAQGIVHRDLKPSNVMIAGERVVLMDFGLAQHQGETDAAGTPGYMAPEQLAGLEVDPRSDLYALGCVTYELATGERVFGGGNAVELATRHASLPPPDLRRKRKDAPRWLSRAVIALLAKTGAPRTRGVALLTSGPRTARIVVLALATLAVAAASVGWWLARSGSSWQPEIASLPSYLENADVPAFSPDGTRISYLSNRGQAKLFRPYQEPRAGGEPTPIGIGSGEQVTMLRWARDGKSWIYSTGSYHVYRAPIDGPQPPVALGRGIHPAECGDGVAMMVPTRRGSSLVIAYGDRPVQTVLETGADQVVKRPRCNDGGDLIVYALGRRVGLDLAGEDIYVADRSGTSRLLAHDGGYPTFTPGARSVVFSAVRGDRTNLYEMSIDGGELHQLTDGPGPDLSPDVSRDGRELVYDVDTTVDAVLIGGDRERTQLTQTRKSVVEVLPVPGGKLLVAEQAGVTANVIAIRIGDGRERVLATGHVPFPSADGTRVLFRALDDDHQLEGVPIAGGAVEPIARFPGRITAGAAGGDGIHVLLDVGGKSAGWRVDEHGAAISEDVAGLVMPAPAGGWRVVVTAAGTTIKLSLVAPGASLASPAHELVSSIAPTWFDGNRLGYAVDGKFVAFDVRTAAVADLPVTEMEHAPAVLALDGKHWFQLDVAGEVTRHVITNFAERPWAP